MIAYVKKKKDSWHTGSDANSKEHIWPWLPWWLFCTRTYAVIVVREDEAVIAAAVEGANCISASSVSTGVSFTLIYV